MATPRKRTLLLAASALTTTSVVFSCINETGCTGSYVAYGGLDANYGGDSDFADTDADAPGDASLDAADGSAEAESSADATADVGADAPESDAPDDAAEGG